MERSSNPQVIENSSRQYLLLQTDSQRRQSLGTPVLKKENPGFWKTYWDSQLNIGPLLVPKTVLKATI